LEKRLTVVTVDAGDWLTLAAVARQRGISKQAVSKKVKALAGVLEVRQDGQSRLVSLSAYDAAVANHSIAEPRATAAKPVAAMLVDPDSSAATKARILKLDEQRREMELERLRGQLLPIEELEQALHAAGIKIAQQWDRLPQMADDIVAVVMSKGADGLRQFLKTKAQEAREAVTRELGGVAELSHEHDGDNLESPIQ
jgi:hypothetical protein